jgi:hypothetical protein
MWHINGNNLFTECNLYLRSIGLSTLRLEFLGRLNEEAQGWVNGTHGKEKNKILIGRHYAKMSSDRHKSTRENKIKMDWAGSGQGPAMDFVTTGMNHSSIIQNNLIYWITTKCTVLWEERDKEEEKKRKQKWKVKEESEWTKQAI